MPDTLTSNFTAQMQKIKTTWGDLLGAAAAISSIPSPFLAALIGNESGGDLAAKRYEPTVLERLFALLVDGGLPPTNKLQVRPMYNGISRDTLVAYISKAHPLSPVSSETTCLYATDALYDLTNSWGLTQIMGWHCFDLNIPVAALKLPDGNLRGAVKLLTLDASRFSLDLKTDAAELLRCWNTGRPDGTTFDPHYVDNGLARMAAYAQLP